MDRWLASGHVRLVGEVGVDTVGGVGSLTGGVGS